MKEFDIKLAVEEFALKEVCIQGYFYKKNPMMSYFTKADYNYDLFKKHRLFVYNKLDEVNNININNIISNKLGVDITSVITSYSGKYKGKREDIPKSPIRSF